MVFKRKREAYKFSLLEYMLDECGSARSFYRCGQTVRRNLLSVSLLVLPSPASKQQVCFRSKHAPVCQVCNSLFMPGH